MSKKCNIGIITVLVLIVILNVIGLVKKDSALKLEELKVGGAENLEKIIEQIWESDYYIEQQSMALEQTLVQINSNNNKPEISDNENLNENDSDLGNEVMIEKFKEIKASGIINGKSNARFTILEYSELLCGYCKRQSDQGTIDAVIKKYPNEVNTVFRNFIVHEQASKLAETIKCVGELKGKSQHEFIKTAYASETTDVDGLIEIASKLGINKNKLKNCIDDGKYTADVNNETNEGRNLFGVSGTPGNVIIDGETGRFILIPGAYPAEKFIEEIEKLKNN